MKYKMTTLDGFLYVLAALAIVGSFGAWIEMGSIGFLQLVIQIVLALGFMCLVRINRVHQIRKKESYL